MFLAYISDGNDDALPLRVKSQCALLRAKIDTFEKSKKTVGTAEDRCPDEQTLKMLDSLILTKKDASSNERQSQLSFYQSLVNELDFYSNPNAMQQD